MRHGYQPKAGNGPRGEPPNEGSSAVKPLDSFALERALRGIVDHWNEFGEMMINNQDDYGFEERIEAAAKLIGR